MFLALVGFGILAALAVLALISLCLSLALIAAAVILFVQNARYGSGIVGASVCLFLGLSGLSGVILFAVRLFS